MKFKSISFGIISAAAMAIAMCGSAQADLIGDTVDLSYLKNGSVQADASGTIPQSIPLAYALFQNATISSDTLTLSGAGTDVLYNGGTYSVDLSLLSGPAFITNVTIGLEQDISGFTASMISFTATSIIIDLTNVQIGQNGILTLNIETEMSQVPEPTSFAILGSGIVALGFFGLRRRKSGDVI